MQLDGELVALDAYGRPNFHVLGSRMLHRRSGIEVTLFVFDVLAVDGHPMTMNSCAERRALLEELEIERGPVRLVATFRGRGGAVRRRLRTRTRASRRRGFGLLHAHSA